MSLILKDRVKETSTTSGNGVFTLNGASTGFQSFAVIGNGNTTYYCIATQGISEWEVGIGTYASAGTTLTRTTVLSNSSGTQPTALTFSGGTKDVFVTYPSGKSVNLDASGNVNINGTVGATTPAAGTFTALTDSGNLTFTGTGNRITGDMSNGTIANRVMFQTSSAGSNSVISAIPNGAATQSSFVAAGNSDPTNASIIQMLANGTTDTRLVSTFFGTGTSLPMTFHTGGSEKVRIDTSGNVGIGLTPSAWTDSIGVIQGAVGTYAISSNGTNNNQFDLLSNAYRSGGTSTYLYFASSTATRYQQVSGAHVWYTAISGTTGGTITFLEKMRIDTSGNVGIGLTPTASVGALQVSGRAFATSQLYVGAAGSTAYSGGIQNVSNTSKSVSIEADPTNVGANSLILFNIDATERMRIDSTGNVGIGTTFNNVYDQVASARPLVVQKSDTNTTLNGSLASITIVNGDTTTNNTAQLNFAAITGASTNQYSSASISTIFGARTNTVYPSGILTFSTSAATQAPAERMRIDSTGNVGINNTNPADTLDVVGNIRISSASLLRWVDAGTVRSSIQGDASSNLIISTGGTERMRIDSVGNTYVETGNLWEYSPAPTALAAGANAGTAAQLRSGMFSAAQTTAVTLTMPTGTAIDTGFAGVPAVDIGFYFYVINTGSALGAVTVAVNTNVTSLGSLVVAIGTSAQFRLRRTASNTYIMYRLS
jgi:hypothetical protein